MSASTPPPTAAPPATPSPPPPDQRVPADERVAGFDRRSIWPGVVLLVVWALWAHALPWLDGQIGVDNPTAAGDVVNLGQGEVTFLPAVGWDLESGALVENGADPPAVPTAAVLSSGVVSYSAKSGNWSGTADELTDQVIDISESLDQLLAKDEQARVAITNADGVPGTLTYVTGVDEAVLIVAFVFDRGDAGGSSADIGIDIEVRGTPDQLQEQVRDIATMIETTTYRPEGQQATS